MLITVAQADRFVEIEVPEHDVLEFPGGIVGFEDKNKFVLFSLNESLFLLQSVDNPYIGFVVIDPLLLNPSYEVDLAAEERALLKLEGDEQPVILAIVTLDTNGNPYTANLRAPLAINVAKRLGVQVVLQDAQYPVRFPIPSTVERKPDSHQDDGGVTQDAGSNGTNKAGKRKKRC